MKILVTHVPAGSGHEKAAEAISNAVRKIRPDAEVTLMNGLDGMSSAYQWAFTQGYLGVIHKYPALWGTAYHLLDMKGLAWGAYKLHRLGNASHGKVLEGILTRHNPDVFIATHFFPAEVASYLKMKGRLKAKLITVITDYMPHSVWISPGTDAYVVGMELTKQELIRRGIPPEKIHVLGIPIDPKFSQKVERRALAARLGLDPIAFTLLICSGGFGTGPVEPLVHALRNIQEPLQALVVTGKNTALYHRLENLRPTFPHDLKVYGFVDNMDELMSVSDLMVTKPGGLSCTEAMMKELPMVLVAPIPGQEARNAKIVDKFGAAVLAGPVEKAPAIIQELRRDPARLKEMGHRGASAGRSNAAAETARLALA
ncbi:MAG: glycosyltransferase [Candidatus Omnitrophota bacterium]|nr:glycosyltransferase [Candidatus Omnitrophota bacterium]